MADNFGWPCYEGAGRQANYDGLDLTLCESLYATGAVVAPHYSYRHSESDRERGDLRERAGLVDRRAWRSTRADLPAAYDGALFFADYSRDCLWVM